MAADSSPKHSALARATWPRRAHWAKLHLQSVVLAITGVRTLEKCKDPRRCSRLDGMAQQHRVTLAEVARSAGVSRTTASYVLNGLGQDMRIAEDARGRVLRAAKELGYRPNLMARSLKTKV